MSSPQPINEEFQSTYDNAGIQPTDIRNVQVSYKNNQPNPPDREYLPRRNTPRLKSIADTSIKDTLKIARRVRVNSVTVTILAWAVPLWLTVQLPLAVISLAMMGLAGLLSEILNTFKKETGFLGTLFTITTDIASWVASKVNYMTGVNLNVVDMSEKLFVAFYMVVFMIGLFALLVITIQYTLAITKPLSGKASGLKMGMFMLAMIGYLLPIANLFPWFLLYILAVWRYPN